MSDAAELLAAFDAGELLRPDPLEPNLVDLARAIASTAGVEDLEQTPGMAAIGAHIGRPQQLVFVVADGLGMKLLELLPPDSFLRQQLAIELRTVFPSTTAVALTTLASGEWPAQHGITGWWTYLREVDGAVTVVRFERRIGQVPLGELDVAPEALLPAPSLIARMQRDSCCFLPAAIAGSVYSRYVAGGGARQGYASLARGVDAVIERVRAATAPTYTYLYAPRVDAAAHEYGAEDGHVMAEVIALDQQIERLAGGLGPRARVVLTADHGHLNAPQSKRHLIDRRSAIAKALRIPPAYDSRVMCFHPKEGDSEALAAAVREQYGEAVYLLSVDEVEALGLLGPGPLSPVTRERLGEYVSIVRRDDAIGYRSATGGNESVSLHSQHSGLSPAEMRIPLIVA